MAEPYAVPNEVQGALASDYVHGTDNHLHLAAIGLFDAGGGFIRVQTTDGAHWALLEYTAVSTNDLTGLTQANMTGLLHTDAAYTFPTGAYVYRVCMGEDVSKRIMGPASATSGHFFKADGTSGKKASAAAIAAAELPDAQTAATLTARSAAGLGLHEDGGEGINVLDGGIITLTKQSGARAYLDADQATPTATDCQIKLATENYDIQGEMDVTVKTGTASATSANHLVDTILSPFVAGDVGRCVWNTTDNTYAAITVYNSASDVTLSADIMANTEGYKAYFSHFVPAVTGRYSYAAAVNFSNPAADTLYLVAVKVNGTTAGQASLHSRLTSALQPFLCDTIQLTAGDKVTLWVYHTKGSACAIDDGSHRTFMSVMKVA